MGVKPADLVSLTVEEKLDLISTLWDSIEESAKAPPLTQLQTDELKRRRVQGLSDPDTMIDWSEVQRDLRKRS